MSLQNEAAEKTVILHVRGKDGRETIEENKPFIAKRERRGERGLQ